MTLDAFKKKYRFILTDEMLIDLDDLVKFLQIEMKLIIEEKLGHKI